jgi:hypothetical protein
VAVNGLASTVLVVWGGANVLVGSLVLGDVISPSTVVDERSLRWHVFLWDAWFLAWGVLLAIALVCLRRRARRALDAPAP